MEGEKQFLEHLSKWMDNVYLIIIIALFLVTLLVSTMNWYRFTKNGAPWDRQWEGAMNGFVQFLGFGVFFITIYVGVISIIHGKSLGVSHLVLLIMFFAFSICAMFGRGIELVQAIIDIFKRAENLVVELGNLVRIKAGKKSE